MEDFKIFQTKRRLKQISSSLILIAILIFGWRFPVLGYFIPLCMVLGVLISIRRGRKWCDWYCPRGSFYDVWASNISPKKDIPPILRKNYFRFSIMALLFLVMTANLVIFWPDFNRIGFSFVVMLSVTTLAGIILSFVFHQRSWCLVCPVGTIASLGGGNKMPLKISPSCVECRLCSGVCPIQIKPYIYRSGNIERIKDCDCLKCDLCVAVCPKKALYR